MLLNNKKRNLFPTLNQSQKYSFGLVLSTSLSKTKNLNWSEKMTPRANGYRDQLIVSFFNEERFIVYKYLMNNYY